MPLRKSGTLITTAFAAIALSAATAPGASAAIAPALSPLEPNACAVQPTTKAFASVGDAADYFAAPGGTFEAAAGWTFTGGAKIASGNESVGAASGTRSLSLPVGATATSPAFCIDETNPTFRFAARPDSPATGYQAIVVYRDAAGITKETQFTSSADQALAPGFWGASAVSPLATKIPLVADGGTASVRLKFVSTGNAVAVGVSFWGKFTLGTLGTVSIDSVMVDPYRRG